MPARVSLPSSEPQGALPASHRFDAGQFVTLAVHDHLILPADRAAFRLQYALGLRLARNRLAKRGIGRHIESDLTQASLDVMQELCLRLRQAETQARTFLPMRPLSLPQLLTRIEMLLALDRRAANEQVNLDVPAGDQEPVSPPPHEKSPGAHLLATMKELSSRLLNTTPSVFNREAQPWTNSRIATLVTQATYRMGGYTYTALINICATYAHALEQMPSEPYDESHSMAAERARSRRSSVVMSPHMRTIVVSACRDGLAELQAEARGNGKQTRNLPFVEAAIKVLPLLLDAPDEKFYPLARTLLETEGRFTDQEIHRGLAAAKRHPVFERVCQRIQRGDQWQH